MKFLTLNRAKMIFSSPCAVVVRAAIILSGVGLSSGSADATAQVEQQDSKTQSTPASQSKQTEKEPIVWHFQAVYSLSAADVELPLANSSSHENFLRNGSGFFTESRIGHSIEIPLSTERSIRTGISLLNARSVSASDWIKLPVTQNDAIDWITWGAGSEFFVLRKFSSYFELEAGIQADYLVSGAVHFPAEAAESTGSETKKFHAQKSGFRLTFSGGIGGIYIGPLGLILRVSNQATQSRINGYTDPLRIHGIQVQLGAGLALGRGEP